MKNLYKSLVLIFIVTVSTSCFHNLNTIPLDEDEVTAATVYDDPAAYKQVLAKIYAGLAVSGQQGPLGLPDLANIDEGFSSYLRIYWKCQQLTTDEAIISWNDGTIFDLHHQNWDANNEFITTMYNRIYFQVMLANELLRESTEDKLNERGVDATLKAEIAVFRAEARFMRALSYWHALDMFRNVPLVVEEDGVGSFFPTQATPQAMFDFLEAELKEIENIVPAPRQNEYGRADQAAVWMLLAKLYMNAEVYTGTGKYTECLEYLNKVIGAGYALQGVYDHLFFADNETSPEFIFPIRFDGINTRTWGGMTFLVHAAIGADMPADSFGVDGGWDGLRTTKELVLTYDTLNDGRARFWTQGQTLEIDNIGLFTHGYAVMKYFNIPSSGGEPTDLRFPDTDFPVFRLGDAYLMYAEAVLRGGTGGDANTAVGYINQLRERGYGNTSGNITANELTLDFVMDERARELLWEGHRRTDLVRFGQFSDGDYTWAWKGKVKEGKAVEGFRDIFPIPSSDLGANPNLEQNTGY